MFNIPAKNHKFHDLEMKYSSFEASSNIWLFVLCDLGFHAN